MTQQLLTKRRESHELGWKILLTIVIGIKLLLTLTVLAVTMESTFASTVESTNLVAARGVHVTVVSALTTFIDIYQKRI